MIGLLSGHMFFLISRRGSIHFSGAPAILFSCAVIASAAASAVAIVDHYDRRDNEESYKKMRRLLWCAAAAFLVLSAFVGIAERTDLVPYTDSRLGFLSTQSLRSLLTSSWLTERLTPHRTFIDKWSLILFFWCLAGLAALSKTGLLKNEPSPGVALFAVLFLVGPAVAAFTLQLTIALASGSITSRPLGDEALRAQIAWMHSMLLTSILMFCVVLFVAVATFLRVVGVLPSQNAGQSNAV